MDESVEHHSVILVPDLSEDHSASSSADSLPSALYSLNT